MLFAHNTLMPVATTPGIAHSILPTSGDQNNHGTLGRVPLDALEAKAKLRSAKATESLVAAIMAIGTKRPELMSAIVDCICSRDTARAISHRYSIHESVLSYWSRRFGLPLRRRGRRALRHPTLMHQKILELVHQHGVAEAARRMNISKQRASQIVGRWAPELKGRRRSRKVAPLSQHKRRPPPRNIVVSFRISTDEYRRLLAARPSFAAAQSSGFGKARAIVLDFIAPTGGDDNEPLRSSTSPAPGTKNVEAVNVYNANAA